MTSGSRGISEKRGTNEQGASTVSCCCVCTVLWKKGNGSECATRAYITADRAVTANDVPILPRLLLLLLWLFSLLSALLYSRPHTAAGRPPPLLPNLSLSSTPDTPERTNACKKIKVEEEEEEAFSLSHEDFRLLLLLLLRKTKQEPSRDIQS